MRAAALHAFTPPEKLAEWRQRGVDGLLARFEREVDPEGRYSPEVRREKALHLRRLHMNQLADASAVVRRRRATAKRAAAGRRGSRVEPERETAIEPIDPRQEAAQAVAPTAS